MNEQELLIELLLPLFENPKYLGWKNIAIKLLKQEECIVAGDNPIWIGGVGNFITLESNTTFIGCNKYIFDYYSFIKSKLVKEYIKVTQKDIYNTLNELKEKIEILSEQYRLCNTIQSL